MRTIMRTVALFLVVVMTLCTVLVARAVGFTAAEAPESNREEISEETVQEPERPVATVQEKEVAPPEENESTTEAVAVAAAAFEAGLKETAGLSLTSGETIMTKGYGIPVSPGYPVTFQGRSLTIYGINPHYIGGKVVFCLDPGSPSEEGVSYRQDATNTLWQTALTTAQRSAIALAVAYGYPNRDYPIAAGGDKTEIVADAERIGATQVIIWEIVLGKRSATAPFRCLDATLKNSIGSNYPTFHQTYDAISAALSAHKDVPSFANRRQNAAPSYEMTRKSDGSYTLTLRDSKGVLSDYRFSSPVQGISFQYNGNTLTVTATAAAASSLKGGVLASATGHSLDVEESILLVWAPTKDGLQTCGQLKMPPDPVPAYFFLTAPQNGGLRITKTVDHGSVDGFTFTVKGGTFSRTYTTDKSGIITIADLLPGVYTVQETSSQKSVNYVLPAAQTISVSPRETANVTFQNCIKQVRVTIQKSEPPGLPYGDKRSLAGAVFAIYGSDGSVITTMTTDAAGQATSSYFPCQTGVYIQETKAPPGYQCSEERISVPEAAASNCSAQYTTISKTCVEMPISANLRIIKTDAQEQTPLSGAGFRILCDGVPIAEEFTDEDGEIIVEGLYYGVNYSYQEFQAPKGYQLDDTVFPFSITEHGKTILQRRENERREGALQIRKTDTAGSTLQGAVFLLEFSLDRGTTWAPTFLRDDGGSVDAGGCTSDGFVNGTLATDENGIALFTGLRADGSILYRLTEIKAPENQMLPADPLYVGTLPVETTDPSIPDGETLDGVTYGYTFYVHVVDSPPFQLPMTGAHDFRLLPVVFCTIALALTGILLRWKTAEDHTLKEQHAEKTTLKTWRYIVKRRRLR